MPLHTVVHQHLPSTRARGVPCNMADESLKVREPRHLVQHMEKKLTDAEPCRIAFAVTRMPSTACCPSSRPSSITARTKVYVHLLPHLTCVSLRRQRTYIKSNAAGPVAEKEADQGAGQSRQEEQAGPGQRAEPERQGGPRRTGAEQEEGR